MIHHCVFFTFRDEVDQTDRTDLLSSLANLVDHIAGMTSFAFGPNADFEGKSPLHRDGFVAVFEHRDALVRYATDPRHLELGRRLVDSSVGGADGVMVFDIVSS